MTSCVSRRHRSWFRCIRRRKVSPLEVVRAVLRGSRRSIRPLNAYCTVAAEQALAAARRATAAVGKRERDAGAAAWGAGVDQGPDADEGDPDDVGVEDLRASCAGGGRAGRRAAEGGRRHRDRARRTRRSSGRAPTRSTRCSGRRGTRGTRSSRAAGRPAAGRSRWRRGWGRSRRARISADRCGCRRPSAASSASAPRRARAGVANATAGTSLSVQGPMARTVADTALMLSTIVGPDPRVPISYPVDVAHLLAAVRRRASRGCASPGAATSASRRWTTRCGA